MILRVKKRNSSQRSNLMEATAGPLLSFLGTIKSCQRSLRDSILRGQGLGDHILTQDQDEEEEETTTEREREWDESSTPSFHWVDVDRSDSRDSKRGKEGGRGREGDRERGRQREREGGVGCK
jgi:hypothetical protein